MHTARHATVDDLSTVGELLHDFNVEFGEPAPEPHWMAARMAALLESGDTSIIVSGKPAIAVAVVRYRQAIWTSGLEAYLAELYVVPKLRGEGIGTAIMELLHSDALERGTDYISIGVDEEDHDTRRFYERIGFTNRGRDGGYMYYYEREFD